VIDAEKLAADYERGGQSTMARVCYPRSAARADLLHRIGQAREDQEKEATAREARGHYANKVADTGCRHRRGRSRSAPPVNDLKMTLQPASRRIGDPKELRDFPLGAMIGLIADSVDEEGREAVLSAR